MVAAEDLLGLTGGLIEENEVLQQVHEVRLVADALEERLHIYCARFVLRQALPLLEVFPLAGDRADLRVLAVAEHHHGIVVENVWNGVAVVRIVVFVGGLEILVDILALDKEQRQSVHKPDDVGSPAVEVALNPEFADTQEVVVLGVVEIEHAKSLFDSFAFCVLVAHLDAIADQVVLVLVGGGDRLCRK